MRLTQAKVGLHLIALVSVTSEFDLQKSNRMYTFCEDLDASSHKRQVADKTAATSGCCSCEDIPIEQSIVCVTMPFHRSINLARAHISSFSSAFRFANQACDQQCNVISHVFVDTVKLCDACAAGYADTRDSMQVFDQRTPTFLSLRHMRRRRRPTVLRRR